MANVFDQFDDGNPFDQFDEKKLDTSLSGLSKGPAAGAAEAALSMLAPLPSQIAGGLYGLGTLLSGQGLDKAAAASEKVQDWNFGAGRYTPASETGKELAQKAGEVFAYPGQKAGDLGAAIGKKFGNEELGRLTGQLPVDVLMDFLPLGGVLAGAKGAAIGTAKAVGKFKGKVPKPEPKTMESVVSDYQKAKESTKIPDDLGTKLAQDRYINDAQVDRLQHVLNKENKPNPTITVDQTGRAMLPDELHVQRMFEAQDQIQRRQDILEQDVARQATLDFNAAERARQEASSTGYPTFVEQMRNAAEQRLPQNTTPLEFAKSEPPYSITNEPFRYDNGINFDTFDKAALPIEISDMLGKDGGPVTDPFNRYSPQQVANRILRDDEHPPIIKSSSYTGRFNKQRGALLPTRRPEERNTLPNASEIPLVKVPVIKQELSTPESRKLSSVIDLKGTPYDRVTTVQGVLDNPGPDLSGFRGLKDPLQSGLEGTLRHNTKNAGVNFARSIMQTARNHAEQLSKYYLTDSKTGLNAQLNKLSMQEKMDVVSLMLELDKKQMPLDDGVMKAAGFNERQISVAQKMRDANDALYAEKNRALGEQGYDSSYYRQGHMPGNFGGAYRTLIGYTDKNGKFHITGIAQADTALEHKQAVEWYRSQNSDKYTTEINLGRSNVSTKLYKSSYDGWADLIQEIAKHDESFGDALAVANQRGKDAVASLYNHQVHESKKKGIIGSYGNRPWLDRETNTKEFLRGFIDYLEEGYKYASYQGPLNQLMELTRNPDYRSTHPNTVKYLDKYVKHVTGNNLNPIGAAANWTIDKAAQTAGLGNSQFNRANRELAQASTLHMMGVMNPGFFLAQLTQWLTGGVPEAAAIRAALKQDPAIMVDSLQRTIMDAAALSYENNYGKVVRDVPQHTRDAYKWGHDNGLFTFSEVALAHQVLQSKLRRKVEPMLDWPIRLGEQATRPTVFLAFNDMFHKAGFKGEEAYLRAQAATDYAMVNYHPDERPMIYQSLGALGTSLGALSTYKHNLVSQFGSRIGEGAKNPAALAAMLGAGYALYGVSGLPGYQEASDMAEKISGKPLREILLDNPKEASSTMDGLLSAKTGFDFQSRLSMASVLPDSPMSAFPHISNFFNVMDKAYEAGLNYDKGSAQELLKAATPAGLRGTVEASIYPDGNILDKNAKQKYDTPRDTKEQVIRGVLGARPLREKLQDEQVWSTRKEEAKRQEKLKKAQERFDRAFLLGDDDGMAKADDDYTSNGGDPSTLYSSNRLKGVVESANMSEEQRRAGKPTKNLNTLKRYEEFTN